MAVTDSGRTRIEVNGVVYHSLDDVPEALRPHIAQLLADVDGDGVPDILQGPDATTTVISEHTETFIVDGTVDSSVEHIVERHRAEPAPAFEPQAATWASPRTTATNVQPASIVTKAGSPAIGSRALIALMTIGAVVVGLAVWLMR